ncbi:MAG: hypothetical protein FWF54_00280 [Candidatus Azobacteroides sp.]|nr:hypothetical protein [Candidatus Azobacteroides sp.]
MAKHIDEIRLEWVVIRDEILENENKATRVGSAGKDLVDYIKELSDKYSVYILDESVVFSSRAQARANVPENIRKQGLIITYRLSGKNTLVIEQFLGGLWTSEVNNDSRWNELGGWNDFIPLTGTLPDNPVTGIIRFNPGAGLVNVVNPAAALMTDGARWLYGKYEIATVSPAGPYVINGWNPDNLRIIAPDGSMFVLGNGVRLTTGSSLFQMSNNETKLVSDGIYLSSRSGDINLNTVESGKRGKAYYNGDEIATLNNIPVITGDTIINLGENPNIDYIGDGDYRYRMYGVANRMIQTSYAHGGNTWSLQLEVAPDNVYKRTYIPTKGWSEWTPICDCTPDSTLTAVCDSGNGYDFGLKSAKKETPYYYSSQGITGEV